MRVGKWLIEVGTILALVAGLSLPTSLAQADGVTVTLDAPDQVSAGSEFVARLNISHVDDFDVAVLRVRFNPAILSLTSVTDGNIGGTTIPIAATVEKEPGLIGITANVAGFPGVTGEGCLMEFHFSALATSTVDIGLEHHSLSNKDAQEIIATWVRVGDLVVGAEEAPSPPAATDVAATTSPESPTEPTSESSGQEATEPAIPPLPPSPSSNPITWPLIGGIIAGVIVVGIVLSGATESILIRLNDEFE